MAGSAGEDDDFTDDATSTAMEDFLFDYKITQQNDTRGALNCSDWHSAIEGAYGRVLKCGGQQPAGYHPTDNTRLQVV
jgi:hypothetical protein